MTLRLTHREAELFEFLIAHVKAHGISPSYEECLVSLGMRSRSSIARLVAGLEAKGLIRRLQRRARGIEVLHPTSGHVPDCACEICTKARFAASIKLFDALAFEPPAKLLRTLVGLRSPTVQERAGMLGIHLNGGSRKHAANRTARP